MAQTSISVESVGAAPADPVNAAESRRINLHRLQDQLNNSAYGARADLDAALSYYVRRSQLSPAEAGVPTGGVEVKRVRLKKG